jgi:hypothetical protein
MLKGLKTGSQASSGTFLPLLIWGGKQIFIFQLVLQPWFQANCGQQGHDTPPGSLPSRVRGCGGRGEGGAVPGPKILPEFQQT